MVTTYTEFQEKLGDARCCLARLSGTYADQLALGLCGDKDTYEKVITLDLYIWLLECFNEADLTAVLADEDARCGLTYDQLSEILDEIDIICDNCGC